MIKRNAVNECVGKAEATQTSVFTHTKKGEGGLGVLNEGKQEVVEKR